MFTIIICNEQIIKDCKESYYTFLKPLMTQGEYEFAAWNPQGSTLEEAVPGLKRLISQHKEWRGIIVLDRNIAGVDAISKQNPFDVCNYVKTPKAPCTAEELKTFRRNKEASFAVAMENPLVKLTNWLIGASIIDLPPRDEVNAVEIDEINDDYLQECRAKRLEPLEIELDRARYIRDDLLRETFTEEPYFTRAPKKLLLVSERAIRNKEFIDTDKDGHIEFEYSSFYEDNLYPNKVRYMIYDLKYVKSHRDAGQYFDFLVFLNLLAGNEYPSDVTKPHRIYKAQVHLEEDKLKQMCNRYLAKLLSTKAHVDMCLRKLRMQKNDKIDSATAETLFESEVSIPVEINRYYDTDEMYCEYKGLGLASDCPQDEESYWTEQYKDIQKTFLRYVREQRRAVKTAVTGSFREQDSISDERALKLNEFQKENVMYHLNSEEEQMVETETSNLFNSETYMKKLEDANDEICRETKQRMSRKKTILAGILAIVLYLIGFVPFFMDVYKNRDDMAVAIGGTAICVAGFILVTLGVLFFFRWRLVKRFKNFNAEMESVLEEIADNLDGYSQYLSHACNVMRAFSVMNYIESDADSVQRILIKHRRDIDRTEKELYSLFESYISDDVRVAEDTEWYDYNYYKEADYKYEMPYPEGRNQIDFLQSGNLILVPVDYVKSVTMAREELYD